MVHDNDLISRAAAIAEIEEYIEEYSELEPETGYHNLKWCAMEEAKDVLSMLPAVNAAPVVHGRWVKVEAHVWKCSICGVEDCFAYDWSEEKRHIVLEDLFCPHCGAKMDAQMDGGGA